VLMASAIVLLKHETSTLRQRHNFMLISDSPAGPSRVYGVLRQKHNFISIDLTFGVSDNVREVTSPDKVGSDPMSGRDATWGQHNTGTVTYFLFVFIFFNRATTHTRAPIFAHNSSKDAV